MKQYVSFSSELLSARKYYCLTSAAAVMEPLGGHDAHRDAGLVEGAPQGAGSGVAQALRRGTSGLTAPGLRQALPCPPSGGAPRTSHDNSFFSSISLITVGSARLRVAFRTNPISLFIALGFPFFISITTCGCCSIVAWHSCSSVSRSCISSSFFSETICAGVFPSLFHSSANTCFAADEEMVFLSSRLRSSASAEGVTGLSLTARFCCFKKTQKSVEDPTSHFLGLCPSFFYHILEELQ